MIEIKKVNKIYNQNKPNPCHALKDVSFTLPNKGLVFILGKSGSGKSTLLNLIGGMDDITSGDILVDGSSLKHASIKELNYYRSNYISIIYQNFCLFENETVLQNILLSKLISRSLTRKEDINHILKLVDLEKKKDVRIKELSGGQKQRVAIARALLKSPKLLLADEPSGNLDSRTAKNIFNILVKISKDILVVIISHDVASAEKYADRIIEIGDGRIKGDKIVNPTYHEVEEDENTIYLDAKYKITQNRIDKINSSLKKDHIKIIKKDQKYIPLKEQPIIEEKPVGFFKKIKNRRLLPSLSIGRTFFKTNVKSFITSLFIISFIFSLSVSSQLFTSFNQSGAIYQCVKERELPNFTLNKVILDKGSNDELNINTTQGRVTDDDISFIKQSGYKGNIYPIYNTPLTVHPSGDGAYTLEKRLNPGYSSNYALVYPNSGLGTCVCDLSYLNKVFGGKDKTLELAAGSLKDLDKSTSLIVTDYFADGVLQGARLYGNDYLLSDNPNDPYCNMLNVCINNRYYVAAVIKTNYKEKYKTTFRLLDEYFSSTSPSIAKQIMQNIKTSDEYEALMDYAQSTLNITYSINPNFASDFTSKISGFANDTYTRFCDEHGNILYTIADVYDYYYYKSEDIKEGEIRINLAMYNKMFNAKLVSINDRDFEKKDIIVDYFDRSSKGQGQSNATLKLRITSLCDDERTSAYLSPNDFIKTKNNDFAINGLMFDEVHNACNISTSLGSRGFTIQSVTFTAIRNLSTIVNVFTEIFIFVFAVLLGVIAFIELSYYLKMIRRNKYRMGVYRSLGVSSGTLGLATLGNSLIFNGILLVLSLGLSIGSAYLVNYLLTKSFVQFLNMGFVSHLNLVPFSFGVFFALFGVFIAISIAAIIIPIIKVRKIKPNVMMNSAEDK